MILLRFGLKRRLYFSLTMLVLCIILAVWSLAYIDEQELSYDGKQPVVAPDGEISIVVKVSQRILEVQQEGKVYKRYRIAVGKGKSPTPVGEWVIANKDYSYKALFGTRWMGLNIPWGSYGIHGTNNPWSIGHFASQGCIRMRNKDVEELFEWTDIGTPVTIEGPRLKVQRVLKYQTTGQDVVFLQLKLKELGYLKARADGLFGKSTEQAVRELQRDKKIQDTGIVDGKTLKALGI